MCEGTQGHERILPDASMTIDGQWLSSTAAHVSIWHKVSGVLCERETPTSRIPVEAQVWRFAPCGNCSCGSGVWILVMEGDGNASKRRD